MFQPSTDFFGMDEGLIGAIRIPMALFTLVHVILSLVAIAAGFVVAGGMLSGKLLRGWTWLFLATTIATSATGFGFPFEKFLPAHAIGIVSLVLLGLAVYALTMKRLEGIWRPVFLVTSLASLYLNVLVLIVQTFLKFPVLHQMAPQQTELPFALTQGLTLAAFVALGAACGRQAGNWSAH
jgi:hypothetical protein